MAVAVVTLLQNEFDSISIFFDAVLRNMIVPGVVIVLIAMLTAILLMQRR